MCFAVAHYIPTEINNGITITLKRTDKPVEGKYQWWLEEIPAP
jgi:hypothetical protein